MQPDEDTHWSCCRWRFWQSRPKKQERVIEREKERQTQTQRMERKSLKPSLFVYRLPLWKTPPQPPAASQGPYCILSLCHPTHKRASTHSLKTPLITIRTHVYRELGSCVLQTHTRSMKSLCAHLIPVPSGYQRRDTVGEDQTKKEEGLSERKDRNRCLFLACCLSPIPLMFRRRSVILRARPFGKCRSTDARRGTKDTAA